MAMASSGNEPDQTATSIRPARASDPGATGAFLVRVTAGPDAGASLTIDAATPGRVLVGQSPACALRLQDREASRRHLALTLEGERLRLTDLGSTNGTFVGRLAVTDVFLEGGEELRLGGSVLRIERIADGNVGSPSDALRFGRVLGGSVEMRRLYPLCERLAESTLPVILEGETGTGKELLAESLHEEGVRAKGPFVVLDCGGLPARDIDLELLGAEAGVAGPEARPSVFERASGGTLLLDEVAELPADAQPKLLRILERGEVRRLGGAAPIRVDPRILVVTRKDLDREVQGKRLREDLYFRLAGARLELPPLRRRGDDVALLARHFWRQLDTATPATPCELPPWFASYDWPGNVRELRNAVGKLLVLREMAAPPGGREGVAMVSAAATTGAAPPLSWADEILALDLPLPRARQRLSEEFERRYVERIVARYGGNVARAAAASGLARRYFQLLRARHQKP